MEFVDIILILLYVASMVAACAVLWSVIKHARTDKELQEFKKELYNKPPLPFVRLTVAVWLPLIVIFSGTALLFKGDLASVMMTTLLISVVATMLTVAWSANRRK